jgi:signal transduction histidine kinase/DNA-binding response OmpR family regulator
MRIQPHTATLPVPPSERTAVLLVDDLPEKLLIYETILQDLHLELVVARSGQDALKEVLRREFAVILLDVNMPGMDGFETAALIRQRKRSSATPIIFLTAFADEVRETQGYASGAVDYIPSPIVPDILRAKVAVFVELFEMRRVGASQAEEKAKRAAAEDSARRSLFIAEAGNELMRSMELEAMVKVLAGMSVPFLADLSVFVLADGRRHPSRTECVWTTKDGVRLDERSSLPACPYPWLMDALERTLVTDQFRMLTELPQWGTVTEVRADDPGPHLPDLQGGSALLLPLSVRGRVHGALGLLRTGQSLPYGTDDITLARELAVRASIALENAVLVRGIQEADRRKDEFLGMLAHELRNPLAPMRNAVHILDLVSPKDPVLEQARDVIDRQVTHMTRLVDDLLDATRIARGKILLRKEQCDLARIVRQTVADYRSLFDASGVRLASEVPETALWTEGDPTRLAQAVGNLLHNAHKFTDPGGTVIARLVAAEGGRMAVLTIRDTGVGIDAAILPHVFEVFRQAEQGLDRSRGGLGLGLTLVKGLVEMHGGAVLVTSDGPGKGSEFTIRLPLSTGPAPQLETKHAEPRTVGAKRRILVIDDNRDAAEMIRSLLTREGHDVLAAFTGPAGLEAVLASRPEIVLCDIGLPGMDGYQIARQVRQDPAVADAYMIALTGYGREEDKERSRQAGFDLHMTKPIDFTSLRRALSTIPGTRNA